MSLPSLQSFILRDWTGRKKTKDSQALASYLQWFSKVIYKIICS